MADISALPPTWRWPRRRNQLVLCCQGARRRPSRIRPNYMCCRAHCHRHQPAFLGCGDVQPVHGNAFMLSCDPRRYPSASLPNQCGVENSSHKHPTNKETTHSFKHLECLQLHCFREAPAPLALLLRSAWPFRGPMLRESQVLGGQITISMYCQLNATYVPSGMFDRTASWPPLLAGSKWKRNAWTLHLHVVQQQHARVTKAVTTAMQRSQWPKVFPETDALGDGRACRWPRMATSWGYGAPEWGCSKADRLAKRAHLCMAIDGA